MKLIELRGKPIAGGRVPLVCAPLVASTTEQLLEETARVVATGPDLLEWRVDHFRGAGDPEVVRAAAAQLRKAAGALPILFTCRSQREGGQPITASQAGVLAMYEAVCRDRSVDLVDFELESAPAELAAVRALAREHGLKLVISYHNFQATPPRHELLERFLRCQREGADVAKIATMPRAMRDVLTLLEASLDASEQLAIPLISMSMGPLGALSRISGWAFGSALTFAVGANSSAPGQMPVRDVRAGVALLRGEAPPAA